MRGKRPWWYNQKGKTPTSKPPRLGKRKVRARPAGKARRLAHNVARRVSARPRRVGKRKAVHQRARPAAAARRGQGQRVTRVGTRWPRITGGGPSPNAMSTSATRDRRAGPGGGGHAAAVIGGAALGAIRRVRPGRRRARPKMAYGRRRKYRTPRRRYSRARSYKRRRAGRRTRYRRSSKRRTGGRFHAGGFPRSVKRVMVYKLKCVFVCQTASLPGSAAASTVAARMYFSATDPRQPFLLTSRLASAQGSYQNYVLGNGCKGFDELARVYSKCLVFGSKMTWNITTPNANDLPAYDATYQKWPLIGKYAVSNLQGHYNDIDSSISTGSTLWVQWFTTPWDALSQEYGMLKNGPLENAYLANVYRDDTTGTGDPSAITNAIAQKTWWGQHANGLLDPQQLGQSKAVRSKILVGDQDWKLRANMRYRFGKGVAKHRLYDFGYPAGLGTGIDDANGPGGFFMRTGDQWPVAMNASMAASAAQDQNTFQSNGGSKALGCYVIQLNDLDAHASYIPFVFSCNIRYMCKFSRNLDVCDFQSQAANINATAGGDVESTNRYEVLPVMAASAHGVTYIN